MSRYLLAWDLSGRRVLVVGAGSIGEAKIETLRTTGAPELRHRFEHGFHHVRLVRAG